METSEGKKCPFCSEDIKKEAVKCRYCGEFLPESLPTVESQDSESNETESSENNKPSGAIQLLSSIFVLANVFIGFEIGFDGVIGGLIVGGVSGLVAFAIVKFGDSDNARAVGLVLVFIIFLGLAAAIYDSDTDLFVSPQEEEQNRFAENQILLNSCLTSANERYQNNWKSNCERNAKRVEEGYNNCLAIYPDTAYCRGLWGNPDPSEDCLLPANMADQIEEWRSDAKAECYYMFPIH